VKIRVLGETCYAPRGAYFDGSVRIEGNLVAPFGTHFWKHLTVSGDLELGPCSTVAGHVSCRNALIGGRAVVKGNLTAEGTVFVCDRAVIRSILAGGDVVLRPGIVVGDVVTPGMITVIGKVLSDRLEGSKVVVLPG
jgi:predicted acyltransferase (DUF342 family)